MTSLYCLKSVAFVNPRARLPHDAPLAGNDDEPMNAATKKASDNGFIIVMAIGNYFDGDNDGVVNPWCRPEWVICVGAASSDATKIWPSFCSRFGI
jgi:hypothetical protein